MGIWLLAIGNWQLAVDSWLLAIGGWRLAVACLGKAAFFADLISSFRLIKPKFRDAARAVSS